MDTLVESNPVVFQLIEWFFVNNIHIDKNARPDEVWAMKIFASGSTTASRSSCVRVRFKVANGLSSRMLIAT